MASRWGLSDRELAFARYYVANPNGAEAARKAGYSSKGSSVTATRLMKRDGVRVEIDRLRTAAASQVERLLASPVAVSPDASKALNDDTTAQAIAIRAEADRQVASVTDRAYALAALVENLEIALGRRPVKITRSKARKDGGVRHSIEQILRPDAAAANRAAELIIKHLPQKTEEIGQGPDVVDPQVLAVMQGFRGVAERFQARLDEQAKAKRVATDIDPKPETDVPG